MKPAETAYYHVDVFASRSLSGNGLSVLLDCDGWPASTLQQLTREMRQFESIFLSEISADGARARIFTLQEELDFAGHPLLGAAAVLHRHLHAAAAERQWTLKLNAREVSVHTRRQGAAIFAEMDQGPAQFCAPLSRQDCSALLATLNLRDDDLDPQLPLQVVSTGLPYLIVPVTTAALATARICVPTLQQQLEQIGAQFVYVLDAAATEGRTWDNLGDVEDIATGSAAGPAGAYLQHHGLHPPESTVLLHQGRFTGRPSQLQMRSDARGHVYVSGEVWPVLRGVVDRVGPV